MTQERAGTRWELHDPSDSGPRGITIIENNACRTNDNDGWSITTEDKSPGLRFYNLKSAYCTIDVSFPTKGAFASAYARFATYGIVLRDAAKLRSIGDRLEGRF